jgi:acyl-CoA thioester hydrolase
MNKVTFFEEIYTYHIDFVGHVNNINYVQWMEHGRVKLLNAMGLQPAKLKEEDGAFPILTDTYIRYKKPLFIDNKVRIDTWVSKLYNASAIMEFRFYNEKDELCATGYQKGLFIDKDTMRPYRLRDHQRKAFEQYLIEE